MPWNASAKATTGRRPVTWRASYKGASTAMGAAGPAGAVQPVVEPARRQDDLAERAQELALRHGVEVEPARHAVARQVVDQARLQDRVIVPVVERAAGGQEVDVLGAVLVPQPRV